MIPQTLSTDEAKAFKKYLRQQDFFIKNAVQGFFLDDLITDDELAQLLSAWKEFEAKHSGKVPVKELKKTEEPHGHERLEQLKKENL